MKKSEINEDLSEFFNIISSEKKRKKEEFESLVTDSFDSLFWKPLVSEPLPKSKKVKKKKVIKEETVILEPSLIEEIEEPYDKQIIKPLIEKSLGLLAEPSDKKQNNDPLTPLNQNFVTLEQFNKHYNQFISRIQQQLSTLGGGGETNLTFMDVPLTSVTTSFYRIKPQDYYIGVNFAGAVTIILPKADRQGKIFVVKDELGESSKGTNRYITILPTGSDLIDNRDRAILAYDYGSLTFIWKDNSWRVV
jgi:hypothetical protein